MNNTFSFKRFSGYLKMLLAERRRSLLISTIIVTVLLLLIMLVASYTCYSWYFSGPTAPDECPQ
jgi:putative effector of murein hydrolase